MSRWMIRTLFFTAVLTVGGGADSARAQFLTMEQLTNGPRVRAAFRDVVRPARDWTVRVRRGDRDVALGLIVAADGRILTKASELKPPPVRPKKGDPPPDTTLTCRLADGRLLAARILAEEESTDLALLKVEASKLPTVAWAAEPKFDLGRWVITPAPSGESLSIGVVSSQRRKIAATQIPGFLGVDFESSSGPARIRKVFESSAAEAAGLEPGDTVERFGDDDIASARALTRLVRRRRPGDVIVVKVKRGNEVKTVEVTLSHPFGLPLSQYAQQIRMGTDLSHRRDGFDDVLSHDGVMRPEDCGGAVLDLSGKAVAVNIARAGRFETLALPAEVVKKALERLEASASPADAR